MSGARNFVVLAIEHLETSEKIVLCARSETAGAVFLTQFVNHDEVVTVEGLELTSSNFSHIHLGLVAFVEPGRRSADSAVTSRASFLNLSPVGVVEFVVDLLEVELNQFLLKRGDARINISSLALGI